LGSKGDDWFKVATGADGNPGSNDWRPHQSADRFSTYSIRFTDARAQRGDEGLVRRDGAGCPGINVAVVVAHRLRPPVHTVSASFTPDPVVQDDWVREARRFRA
jgi:hypothetical protein